MPSGHHQLRFRSLSGGSTVGLWPPQCCISSQWTGSKSALRIGYRCYFRSSPNSSCRSQKASWGSWSACCSSSITVPAPASKSCKQIQSRETLSDLAEGTSLSVWQSHRPISPWCFPTHSCCGLDYVTLSVVYSALYTRYWWPATPTLRRFLQAPSSSAFPYCRWHSFGAGSVSP